MNSDAQRLVEIRKTLWANREMPIHEMFLELLDIKLRQGRDELVENCTPANFPIVQGQAKAYAELIKLLRKAPIEIPKDVKHGEGTSSSSTYHA